MLFRKQAPPTPFPWTETEKYTKNKETSQYCCSTFIVIPKLRYINAFLFVFLAAWFLVLLFWFPPPTKTDPPPSPSPPLLLLHHQNSKSKTQQYPNNDTVTKSLAPVVPTCNLENVAVYVYELPAEFNLGLLKDCRHLNVYTDMCPHVANCGLGQPLLKMHASSSNNWFATHQFIAEMIFHARVENHPCRTWDPNLANLFYVPFYGGLYSSSKFREANLTARDALAVGLADYLQSQPPWLKHNGKDHFLVLGRTAWDFMRASGVPDFGANSLLNLPPVLNMSVLTVERHPWNGSNQHGIPYPSYFHPATSEELLTWQNMVRESKRTHLWSFIGAPRKGLEKAAIRDEIIVQCNHSHVISRRCNLLKCGSGASKCHEPTEVLNVMTKSQFCVQAPGDSFTRRSTFDSILAGCIPVFFSPHTAYTQYAWFLPEDPKSYSVYINEKGSDSMRIEEELLKISSEKVVRMRNRIIDLIPSLTYSHPNASDVGFRDAVDVALVALSKHVDHQLLLD